MFLCHHLRSLVFIFKIFLIMIQKLAATGNSAVNTRNLVRVKKYINFKVFLSRIHINRV